MYIQQALENHIQKELSRLLHSGNITAQQYSVLMNIISSMVPNVVNKLMQMYGAAGIPDSVIKQSALQIINSAINTYNQQFFGGGGGMIQQPMIQPQPQYQYQNPMYQPQPTVFQQPSPQPLIVQQQNFQQPNVQMTNMQQQEQQSPSIFFQNNIQQDNKENKKIQKTKNITPNDVYLTAADFTINKNTNDYIEKLKSFSIEEYFVAESDKAGNIYCGTFHLKCPVIGFKEVLNILHHEFNKITDHFMFIVTFDKIKCIDDKYSIVKKEIEQYKKSVSKLIKSKKIENIFDNIRYSIGKDLEKLAIDKFNKILRSYMVTEKMVEENLYINIEEFTDIAVLLDPIEMDNDPIFDDFKKVYKSEKYFKVINECLEISIPVPIILDPIRDFGKIMASGIVYHIAGIPFYELLQMIIDNNIDTVKNLLMEHGFITTKHNIVITNIINQEVFDDVKNYDVVIMDQPTSKFIFSFMFIKQKLMENKITDLVITNSDFTKIIDYFQIGITFDTEVPFIIDVQK